MRRIWLALILGGIAGGPLAGESPACNRARDMVATVAAMYGSEPVDHRQILGRLGTARDLCPSLGDAWKYSYCSAVALGDKKADYYRQRAVLNGVQQLDCPGGVAAPRALPSTVRRKYALLIGIGQFADKSILPLQFAAKDAEDLAGVLRDPRYGNFGNDDVVVLTDAEATRANILRELQQILLKAQEDDLVLLFVSSHGSPSQETGGLGGIGYIVTHDTTFDRIWENGLEYQAFAEKVARIAARRKVTLLDTCYSGQVRQGRKALVVERFGVDPDRAKLFLSGEGSYVITSSRKNEVSWESEKLQNGFFTYFLIAALREGKEPPTLRQVFGSMAPKVRDAVAREKGAEQNPEMLPRDSAEDLRIGVIPQSP